MGQYAFKDLIEMERSVRIIGTGSYLPGAPVKFDDIDGVLGTFDEVSPKFRAWYKRRQRTLRKLLGLEDYYFAIDRQTGETNETCAGMASKAARMALKAAQIEPATVDLLIYAGSSMDRFICPPTSVFVQQELEIEYCAELSIHSNCTATYKALQVATDQIANGRYQTALVVSANLVSSALKADFFNQAELTHDQAILRMFLSDGAGALLLKAAPPDEPGMHVVETYLESVGTKHEPHMYNRMGASSGPMPRNFEKGFHHVSQEYRDVSVLGPRIFIEGLMRWLTQMQEQVGTAEYSRRIHAARRFLVNVPTRHLIDLTADELRITFRKKFTELRKANYDMYYSTIDKRGYTGPVAILQTLDRLLTHEQFEPDETVFSFVTESSKWMNAGFMLEWRT